MANEDTKIRFSIINDATAVLEKIRSDFLDLSKTLSAKELSGATLNQLEARLRAVRAELANVSPESANFEKLAAEARRLGDAIDTVNAKAKGQTFEIRAAAGSMAELEARVKAVRAELLKTDPKSARFQELAKQAAQLDAELSKVSDEVIKFANQSKKAGSDFLNSLTGINQGLELASKGFGLLANAASSAFGQVQGTADFEQSLATLRAVTAASADEMKRLEDAAVSASQRTRFSSTEAAQGLTELARAGLDATDAINVLNPALALAQGNNISVAQSSELLTTTIKQFGASMAEAAVFADTLQATADKTSTSVEQIGLAMSYAAPLARQLGLSVQDTSAIIGALADQGFRGERAGTALRNVFSSLLDPSSKFAEALRDAGIKSTNFAEVIEQLAGKGDKAKEVLLALDAEARPAILSLVNNGGKAVTELRGKLDDLSGAAQRTSDIMGDTFNGALDRLQNTFENTRNALLAPILKPLADEFDSFAKQLQAFSKSEEFAKLVEDIRKFASEGIKAVGELVRNFDFAEALRNAQAFASDVKVVFEGLASAIGVAASAIDAVKTRLASRDLSFSSLALSLNDLSRGANASELGLRTLQGTLGLTDEQTAQLANTMRQAGIEIPKVGNAAASSAAKLVGFAAGAQSIAEKLARLAAGDSGFNAAASAAEAFRKALSDATQETDASKGKVSESADAFVRLAGGADQAALGLERLRLAQITQKLTEMALAGQQGTAAFAELVKQSGQTEENIKRLADKLAGASDETDRLGSSAERAGSNLRDLKGSVDDVADSAENLSNKNSQVRDSFGNIGAAASSTAISLGNLSEEYVRQALAAAGATKSAKEYANTLNRAFAAGQEQQKQLSERLAERQKLILSLDEEAQALERLRQQYPAIAENELRKLYDAERRITELRERKNKATREGIDLEQQAATAAGGTAGGINTGTQRPTNTAPTTPTPTATQPTGGAGSITINVSGFVTQDALDQVVNRIQRAGLLAR